MISAPVALMATAAVSQKDGYYFGGTYGFVSEQKATNSGVVTSDFETGGLRLETTGVADPLPAGTAVQTGTGVGWETSFDGGNMVVANFGLRTGQWRFEGELFTQSSGIDSHKRASVADAINLTDVDASRLVPGLTTDLGVTVGDLIADGQGKIRSSGIMANVYYDFDINRPITPYIGAGFGMAEVKVDYSPSGVRIIDDADEVFAWQVMAGGSLMVTDTVEAFGGLRYRETENANVRAALFPADFEVENSSIGAEIGVRFNF